MAERLFMGHDRGGFAPRRGRGQGQGRGRGWGRGRGAPLPRTVVKPDIVKNPLGELLQLFNADELDGSFDNVTAGKDSITKCENVASYSWTDEETPTIIVPGK